MIQESWSRDHSNHEDSVPESNLSIDWKRIDPILPRHFFGGTLVHA